MTMFSVPILMATPVKSEMIPVTASENGDRSYYVDKNSITFDRNFVEASIDIKYKTPSSDGVSSVTTRWKVNCSYRSRMTIGSAYYDLKGNFLGSNRKPSGWSAVTLGAVDEGIYYFMCDQFRR